ncbi:MAG: HAMP domain-containing histidine kinase [Myxococcales bacterium]|nr:HAMP domain-containing histidine kinase [Myxococcales bacterium]
MVRLLGAGAGATAPTGALGHLTSDPLGFGYVWVSTTAVLALLGYIVGTQRDALQRVQQRKDELAEYVVHDLRNPLTVVKAEADLMAAGLGPPEDLRECGRSIQRAANALMRMVANLLDIHRSEERTLVASRSEVRVLGMLQEVCELARPEQQLRKLQLNVVAPPDIDCVRADPDLLGRIMENLLDNSLRYSPEGGEIRLELKAVPGAIQVWVKDQGPGIPPEHRQRIFEKYVQLDGPSRTGRGLGLAFCRAAAEAHGGRIWVEDNAPRGSAFCVEIPSEARALARVS